MKNIKNTTEDGWDCVPALARVVRDIESTHDHIYEIKSCVRYSNLAELVQNMKMSLTIAIEKLDDIDTSVEFKTVENED